MPTMKLTQLAVERLKPPAAGRVEYFDSQLPGFAIRISETGRKTWIAMYRVSGKLVRETIGTLDTFPSVADARDLARQSLQQAQRGINPVAERRQQKATAAAPDTLGAVIERYLSEYAVRRMRPDYFKETRRALKVDIVDVIGADRPIREITRRDIRAALGKIVSRGRAPHASHVLAYTRAWLNWAVAEEIVGNNPAAGIPDPDPRKREDRERDRYLSNDEIKLFWASCGKIKEPYGSLFRLLLLTGARRDELAHATWSEFDLDKREWTLPRPRSKNDKAHTTHLTPLAIEILEALPRISGDLLFTASGRIPVSNFAGACRRLAAEMGPGVPHFTLHDLRRTIASGMADLGIAEHVLDRVLNHAGRKVSGTARIYNRHEYLKERQAALETWSSHVESLARPTPSNVVELAAAHR
jgi:integrase